MENKKSLLNLSSVDIAPNFSIKIPTVGEILEDEFTYYGISHFLSASPFQYMVQLDDMGIDYTTINDFELFKIFFPVYSKSDMSILFGDIDTSDFGIYINKKDGSEVIYSPKNDILINELVYHDLSNIVRKMNLFEKVSWKPGNDSAKKYLLEKERKKQQRNTKKKQEPYLEKVVIALVDTSEFPYNYDSCMDLSIYKFNSSLRQIQHKIAFDNTMTGVYSGTVDTSKIRNKSCLTWIQQ